MAAPPLHGFLAGASFGCEIGKLHRRGGCSSLFGCSSTCFPGRGASRLGFPRFGRQQLAWDCLSKAWLLTGLAIDAWPQTEPGQAGGWQPVLDIPAIPASDLRRYRCAIERENAGRENAQICQYYSAAAAQRAGGRAPDAPAPIRPPGPPVRSIGFGLPGSSPSRWARLRASLRARRMASAFSRAFFSEGFS
jgi:hypothetical protein